MRLPLWATLMAVTSLSTVASSFSLSRFLDLAGLHIGQAADDRATATASEEDNESLPEIPREKCYLHLGCVTITEDWYHPVYRPINQLPDDREEINTRFILFTRDGGRRKGERLFSDDNSTIRESHLSSDRGTVIIVHGYLDRPWAPWIKNLISALLDWSDLNVIFTDWSEGALSLYTQVAANSRLVALEVIKLIQVIQDMKKVDSGSFHLIGHSLGAHVCGYVGAEIPGIGRITGLDPAEPFFQGMPEFVRLDPTDANFVDVIHSDGASILMLGLGMSDPCGHVDFYPNNGEQQPGCEIGNVGVTLLGQELYEVGRRLFACSHSRAILYFIESITEECPYVGHLCDGYSSFLQGDCDSCMKNPRSCIRMGIYSDEVRPVLGNHTHLKYYLDTAGQAPFCRYQYRVVLHTHRPLISQNYLKGQIKLKLFGSQEIDLSTVHTVEVNLGEATSMLFLSPRKLQNVVLANLTWIYDAPTLLDISSYCFIWCDDKLLVERVDVTEMGSHPAPESLTTGFCSRDYSYTSVPPEESRMFTVSACKPTVPEDNIINTN